MGRILAQTMKIGYNVLCTSLNSFVQGVNEDSDPRSSGCDFPQSLREKIFQLVLFFVMPAEDFALSVLPSVLSLLINQPELLEARRVLV